MFFVSNNNSSQGLIVIIHSPVIEFLVMNSWEFGGLFFFGLAFFGHRNRQVEMWQVLMMVNLLALQALGVEAPRPLKNDSWSKTRLNI